MKRIPKIRIAVEEEGEPAADEASPADDPSPMLEGLGGDADSPEEQPTEDLKEEKADPASKLNLDDFIGSLSSTVLDQFKTWFKLVLKDAFKKQFSQVLDLDKEVLDLSAPSTAIVGSANKKVVNFIRLAYKHGLDLAVDTTDLLTLCDTYEFIQNYSEFYN